MERRGRRVGRREDRDHPPHLTSTRLPPRPPRPRLSACRRHAGQAASLPRSDRRSDGAQAQSSSSWLAGPADQASTKRRPDGAGPPDPCRQDVGSVQARTPTAPRRARPPEAGRRVPRPGSGGRRRRARSGPRRSRPRNLPFPSASPTTRSARQQQVDPPDEHAQLVVHLDLGQTGGAGPTRRAARPTEDSSGDSRRPSTRPMPRRAARMPGHRACALRTSTSSPRRPRGAPQRRRSPPRRPAAGTGSSRPPCEPGS